MNNHRLFQAFGEIDEHFIEEANPQNIQPNRKSKKRLFYLAASVVLILGLSLWLFIPYSTFYDRIEQYSDSEYYALIQKLEANQRARMLNGKKNPTNNFENYVLGFFFLSGFLIF